MEDEKRIEFDDDNLRVYAYGYGCYGNPCNGDAEVEIDMQEYIDAEYNGQYEVERAYYYEDEDCWAAKVLDKSLFDDED